jgi:hypothetical protein
VLRDVANNTYTEEPVELTHRSKLIAIKELVLEFLVGVQLGWVYQNDYIINEKEDDQVIVRKEA